MQMRKAEAAAVSRAGHDSGRYYLILKEEDGYCLLCDGKLRTLDHPKKKNVKHLQKIIHVSSEIREQMNAVCSDADVRKILKQISSGNE